MNYRQIGWAYERPEDAEQSLSVFVKSEDSIVKHAILPWYPVFVEVPNWVEVYNDHTT